MSKAQPGCGHNPPLGNILVCPAPSGILKKPPQVYTITTFLESAAVSLSGFPGLNKGPAGSRPETGMCGSLTQSSNHATITRSVKGCCI